MISIITPTYNREKELKRVYDSLIKQTSNDFEWLVVDDGSTDNTKDLIAKYKKEKKIDIRYVYKVNGGKPSAYNQGVEEAKGELLICLDSDDIITSDAIKTINEDYKKIRNKENIAGIVYNCSYINDNKIIGTSLPNNIIDTYYNIYEKHQVKGDKAQVIKTKVAREFPFPIIENEKFVPEALINNRISKQYNFLYKNKTIKAVEYLSNGYTANYFNLVKRNPKSNALYFKELYSFNKSFYNVYGYILFSIYSRKKFNEILKKHPAKFKIMVCYFPTLIISKIK